MGGGGGGSGVGQFFFCMIFFLSQKLCWILVSQIWTCTIFFALRTTRNSSSGLTLFCTYDYKNTTLIKLDLETHLLSILLLSNNVN